LEVGSWKTEVGRRELGVRSRKLGVRKHLNIIFILLWFRRCNSNIQTFLFRYRICRLSPLKVIFLSHQRRVLHSESHNKYIATAVPIDMVMVKNYNFGIIGCANKKILYYRFLKIFDKTNNFIRYSIGAKGRFFLQLQFIVNIGFRGFHSKQP